MAGFMGIDNSIGWAHWQLKGGWRNLLLTCAGYAAVIGGLILFTVNSGRDYPGATAQTLAGWRIVLLLLDAALLLLFAGSRVAVAVRSDISNRMMESHLLMPVPALSAISGYLWGPTLQPIGLMMVNFLIGLCVCSGAGFPLHVWTWPCIILFEFAVFIWVLAAFSSLIAKLAWGVVFGGLIFVAFPQWVTEEILPPVIVLVSPLIGPSVFQASFFSFDLSPPMLGSLVAQACFGSILYLGAARKYRRPHQSALGVLLSMLLLVYWLMASYVGILYTDHFRTTLYPWMFRGRETDTTQMFCSAIATSMILALIPIANSARDRQRRRSGYSPLIAIGCALLITSLSVVWQNAFSSRLHSVALTGVVVACFLVSMTCILRITYRITPRGWPVGLLWMLLAWLAPILTDMFLSLLGPAKSVFEMSLVSAISPIGAMSMIWDDGARDYRRELAVGTGVQLALALGWMLLFHLTNRSRRAPIASTRALDQIREAVG